MSTVNTDQAQAIVILAGLGVALFVGYKLYKTGKDVADAAGRAVDSIGETVDEIRNAPTELYQPEIVRIGSNAAQTVSRGVSNAYAEVKTFLTGTHHYSPDSLEGSMSRADAEAYARELADIEAARESVEYREMVDREAYSLLRRYPANQSSDPSLAYIGYRGNAS